MTAPAPSGLVKRSRRIYIYWGIALTLLVTVGLVCWLVVVPVTEVRTAVRRLKSVTNEATRNWSKRPWPADYWVLAKDETRWEIVSKEGVIPLGGPEQAARAVSLYLRAPESLAPDKALALVLAGACGDDASPLVPLIISFLEDNDRGMRSAAVVALGRIGDARAVEHLLPLLTSGGKRPLCWHAIEALGRIGDRRAVGPLITALQDRTRPDRCALAEALGKIGGQHAVQALIAALADEDRYVRQSAAEGLGGSRDTRAVKPLEVALVDKEEDVRKAAAEALKKIREKSEAKEKEAKQP